MVKTEKTSEEPTLQELLVRLLDEAYSKTGWIDRSLRRSLRGITPVEAAWRPGPGRHSVWEQVVHLAYWKHVLGRRISGLEAAPFPESGKDWFERGEGDARAWERDRKRLSQSHSRLRETLLERDHFTRRDLYNLVGAAFHDVYHTGQIELTRRLASARDASARAGS